MTNKITALITRPIKQAINTEKQLDLIGISSFKEPLLEIVPNGDLSLDLLDKNILGIILTSANAVQPLAKKISSFDIPIISIGKSTSSEAKEFGFNNVVTLGSTAKSIEEYVIDNYSPRDGSFIYASGDIISRDIKKNLAKYDFEVNQVTSYFTKYADSFSDELLNRFDNIDIVLFYSVNTAKTFKKLLINHNLDNKMGDMMAFCLSNKIANFFADTKFSDIKFAVDCKSDSLLELIVDFKLTKEDI